jgi:L-aspartate oxidase
LRGDGALLLNPARERFMPRYHQMAELAPRDVVARAIVREIMSSSAQPAVAYLDLRHLDANRLREHFPRIYATCKQYGLDITSDLIPVRPAAHYLMGGVKTDLEGRTSVASLYAAGETACTGVHGANRLASNSLLEGLVFGARAVRAMREESAAPAGQNFSKVAERTSFGSAAEILQSLKQAMWKHAGVLRERDGLQSLQQQLAGWKSELPLEANRAVVETRNLLAVGDLICRSALAREESRGAHYRTDFSQHDDARFRKHSVVDGDRIGFE